MSRWLGGGPGCGGRIETPHSPLNWVHLCWTKSLSTCALLCAVVLVPLVNTPDHLIWFDITPKVAALILMVGIAAVWMPSTTVL